FKAPIAGLVFVIEVLMLDLTMTSVLPLLISSVTAATMSYIFTGTDAMFKFSLTEPFEIGRIPYVLLLGIFCGSVSLYFTRAMNRIESLYRQLPRRRQKFLLGVAMLSVLIFLFPPLYGEGYNTIESLLDGQYSSLMGDSLFHSLSGNDWGIVLFMGLILLTKVFASSATNAAGGCGGIFAPSLYLGCIAGFLFAHVFNYFDPVYLPEKNFALMGMAGVMSGVMHAPLTGVFLIAELTGGYDLFLPLMIVSASSYMLIIAFEPHSIYSMRLAKKGELLTHHKDKAILTLMKINNMIETDFLPVRPQMMLGEMVKEAIAHSPRNMFPVVDGNNVLLGLVLVDNIRNIMFRPELYERFRVSKFMVSAPAKLRPDMPMEKIMRIFDDTKAWNLPVVDPEGHYLGFVSRSKIFTSYREVLVDTFSEE
ncbi:MAG: chloride channel protein, partial [Tannerella sp.]|nr:chloride channel protein [Tannerella sp.]